MEKKEWDGTPQLTSETDVGFIFQFPAMKGTRAISSDSEAARAERGAAPLAARRGAVLLAVLGMPAGDMEKAEADAAPVTATTNSLRNTAILKILERRRRSGRRPGIQPGTNP